VKAFLRSFIYAFNGIKASLVEQRNLKVQTLIALITIVAGFCYNITTHEWCIILLSIALVMGFEIINSSIENLVNLVTREKNLLAGKVKDMAAGAVLFASVLAVVIGILIFAKYIFHL
jgi:diacylglycerol kinase